MNGIHSFFVDGRLVYVPDADMDEFLAQNGSAEEADVFAATNADGETREFTVPRSRSEDFAARAAQGGGRVTRMRRVEMDDGETLTLGDGAIQQLVQARKQGEVMSRGLMKMAGIPDAYARGRAEREALADALGRMFPGEGAVDGLGAPQDNLGDRIVRGGNVIRETAGRAAEAVRTSPAVAGAVGAAKGFYEGAIGNPTEAIDDFYGEDSLPAEMLKNANSAANAFVKSGAQTLSVALGGRDTAAGRAVLGFVDGLRTDFADLETGSETGNAVLGFADNFVKETLPTLAKYAAPGVAAVDIMGGIADTYYDAYERALANGAPPEKAAALAAAQSGVSAAEGLWLAKSAAGGAMRSAFKAAVGRVLGMGGKMGVSAGARDVVEQGVEGAENPDLLRTGKAMGEGALHGSLFELTGMGMRALADAPRRAAEAASAKRVREGVEKVAREADARARYESRLSDEAEADINATVAKMVESGVVPSWKNTPEVARRAREKIGGRGRGEDHAAVEQAVMEAAQEVAEGLQTPARVSSAALERRQVEAASRRNEYWARRSEELAREYGAEEAARRVEAERRAAEGEAATRAADAETHAARQGDLDAAFDAKGAHREASMRGMEERARIRHEEAEYERQESERKAREAAEEAAVPEVGAERTALEAEQAASRKAVEDAANAVPDVRHSPEYAEWLRKKGRADTDKNFNRFVMENDLDPSLRVERGREANPDLAGGDSARAEAPAARTAEPPPEPEPARKPAAPSADAEAARRAEIDAMRQDPVLQRIDGQYQRAGTDAERAALRDAFAARVEELRRGAAGQKPTETPPEAQTPPVSKTETTAAKTEIPVRGTETNVHGGETPPPAAEQAAPVPKRSETRRAVIDEGRKSVMASPNAKSYNTGKVGAEKVVYTPKDGGKPFTVGRNAFEHSLRGANAADNAIVGQHLGEALDASSPVGERSANATFRIAPVKVNGEDAHVLFTVVDGKMTEFDVLKGYNTKKNPEGMMSEVGGADAAKAFEVRADSIANLDRAWQERFKPGLVEHAKRKGGSLTFTATARAPGAETPVAEAPVSKPKPARVAVPEPQGGAPLKDAVERLRKVRADKAAAPEAVAEADAAVEAARAPDRPFDPPRPRPNAKAAAKVVGEFVDEFVDEYETRKSLLAPYHDKANGVVVATNGRILIATKHGFDPNAPDREYPKWQQVVPSDKDLTVRTTVNPSALAKACKEAVRLTRATGVENPDENHAKVALRIGDRIEVFSADYLEKVARAMEANGITEIRARGDGKTAPVVAKNGDTTIVLMPLRRDFDGTSVEGLKGGRNADNHSIVISGESGRVISAPERTDTVMLGREYLEATKAGRAARINGNVDFVKKTPTYAMIARARQRGETDAAKAYGEGWDKLSDKSREAYEKALRAKTDAEVLDILADYADSINVKSAVERQNEDLTIKRAERRIAAEDALESLVMRRADAEAYLGRNPQGAPEPPKPPKRLDPKAGETPARAAKGKADPHATETLKALAPDGAAVEGGDVNGGEGRLDMARLDPKRRSDPKVLAWARKQGRTVADGKVTPDAVREYDAQQAKAAAKAAKNWFPDMKTVYHDYGEGVERGQHAIDLRDTTGKTLGWFDPASKEVHLLPGADAKTVAHEIMWHGTRDWAKRAAAQGDRRAASLLAKMREVEAGAPEELKRLVRWLYRKYGVVDADTLSNEYGAWATMGRGGAALERAMEKAENRTWLAREFAAAKGLVREFLAKNGGNRADLSRIDSMGRDEFVEYVAERFAGGKTLGEIGAAKGTGRAVSTKETLWQKYRRKVYDVNSSIRDLQRSIEKKTGRKLTEDEDVEMANALTPGLREAAVMSVRSKLRQYRELLHGHGLSDADVQYYMALKAAAGRDAKVDARNLAEIRAEVERGLRREWGAERVRTEKEAFASELARRQAEAVADYRSTNGSHVDPREARAMLAEIEGGEKAADYAAARKFLRGLMDETLAAQERSGLVSAEAAARFRAEEPDYVPFKNEFDADTGEFVGRGSREFLRPEHYAAKGRKTAAGDVTAHIFGDYHATLLRGIETDVRQKLAALVRANPELGRVERVGEGERPKEKRSSDAKDPKNLTGDPNLVLFKEGGDTYAIRLEGTRGSAVAAAITERNVKRLDGAFAKFARSQAGMATRWSITFPQRNFTKDNIELANIVYSEKGLVKGTKWMKAYTAGQAKNAAALVKYVTTGKIDEATEGGRTVKAFIGAGGLISGGATEGYAAIKDSLTPEAIAREIARGKSVARAAAKHTRHSLAYINEFAELTTRVNAFAAERSLGASDRAAALFARRATVDFNRHGENTGVTNVWRLFSNSTLGATARAAAALGTSKYGRRVAGTLFTLGFAQAIAEEWMNGDEDRKREKEGLATGKDVSEYDRKTSLIHLRVGDKYYKLAQHESPFSLCVYSGDLVARALMGKVSWGEAAKRLGVSTAELLYHFTGFGSINLGSRSGTVGDDIKAAVVSGLVPSALQPFAEVATGIDYKGDPLYRKNFSGETPNAEVAKKSTPEWAVWAARLLNRVSGGSAARKGYVDVHPEAVQKVAEGLGKNAAKDVLQAYEVGMAIRNREWGALDDRNKPFKRDYVKPLDGNTSRFYEAYGEYRKDKAEFEGMRAEWTAEERRAYLDRHPWLRLSPSGKRRVDSLVEAKNRTTPRSGLAAMGINQLRKLADGLVLQRDGRYAEPGIPVPDEVKERAKREILKKQALVLEAMGRQ